MFMMHVCSRFLLLHECAVIWDERVKANYINPISLMLNACSGDGYSVCIHPLTRHGEFYIREDTPGSCLCLMRQRSLSSLNQTLRPRFISQSFHLNSLLSEVWEAIRSVSSSTWTTEEGWACWVIRKLTKVEFSRFSSEQKTIQTALDNVQLNPKRNKIMVWVDRYIWLYSFNLFIRCTSTLKSQLICMNTIVLHKI